MRRSLAIAFGVVALSALPLGGIADALWYAQTGSGSRAASAAASLSAGAKPTAIAGGVPVNDVAVGWSATLLPDGTPVAGYVVAAYDATTGASRAIKPSCSGLVAATSCVETDAPDGAWRYSVVPRQLAWAGLESPRSDAVTVDSIAPAPTALNLVNGGGILGLGVISPAADEVTIAFSEALAVSSICSTWPSNGANQSLSGSDVVVTVVDNAGSNTLSVTTSQCALHFGVVGLGGDYLTGTASATFAGAAANSSRLDWNAVASTLTVHLGARTSGTLSIIPVVIATATYTPNAAITDVAGNPIVTTPFSSPNQRF